MLGLVGPSTRDSVATRFQSMLRVMDRGGRLRSESAAATEGSWALGRVHLGVLQPERQPARVGEVSVLFHGDLANESELRARLAQLGEPPQSGAAAIVAESCVVRARVSARAMRRAASASSVSSR